MLNPAAALKYSLTFSMFTNTIITMGSARHYHFVEASDEGKVSVWSAFNVTSVLFLITDIYVGVGRFQPYKESTFKYSFVFKLKSLKYRTLYFC